MKPLALMMRLKIMDANKTVLEQVGPFQAVTLDDVIFIRMSREEAMSLKVTGALEQISEYAAEKKKSFIILPLGAELLEIEHKWEMKK